MLSKNVQRRACPVVLPPHGPKIQPALLWLGKSSLLVLQNFLTSTVYTYYRQCTTSLKHTEWWCTVDPASYLYLE